MEVWSLSIQLAAFLSILKSITLPLLPLRVASPPQRVHLVIFFCLFVFLLLLFLSGLFSCFSECNPGQISATLSKYLSQLPPPAPQEKSQVSKNVWVADTAVWVSKFVISCANSAIFFAWKLPATRLSVAGGVFCGSESSLELSCCS